MKKNLFLALLLLVALLFVADSSLAQIVVPGNTGLPDPADAPGYAGSGPVLAVLFEFLGWLLSVFTLLAVISFVITGLQYLFSMGDSYKAENAKKSFTYSVIAVAVAAGGLIIIRTIDFLLA